MTIGDHALAEHCLQHISYYRLSAYWLPFENPKGQAGPRFRPGTTFEDVMALYDFDRRLRLLVLDAIERIEVAVRGSWAYQLAMLGGAHSAMSMPRIMPTPRNSPAIAPSSTGRSAGRKTPSSATTRRTIPVQLGLRSGWRRNCCHSACCRSGMRR